MTRGQKLLGLQTLDLAKGIGQSALEQHGHLLGIAVRATQRFVDDLVDQVHCLQAMRSKTQRFGCIGSAIGGFPENGGATFRRND